MPSYAGESKELRIFLEFHVIFLAICQSGTDFVAADLSSILTRKSERAHCQVSPHKNIPVKPRYHQWNRDRFPGSRMADGQPVRIMQPTPLIFRMDLTELLTQQQRIQPPRKAIQNSWSCIAQFFGASPVVSLKINKRRCCVIFSWLAEVSPFFQKHIVSYGWSSNSSFLQAKSAF